MKKVLVAPAAFKGTLSASSVAGAVDLGIKLSNQKWQVDLLPLADGGDGTLEALAADNNGIFHKCPVRNALQNKHTGTWLRFTDLDVVELASLCGLAGLNHLAPLATSTHGLGDALKDMIANGARKIAIGLGGSASTDGGAGMLQALGAEFYQAGGKQLETICGGNLNKISTINLNPALELIKNTELVILADVTNPLTGKEGAAQTFAPQKGATIPECAQLEANLIHFADIAESVIKKQLRSQPGMGAAGGCAFGLSLLNATITPGFSWISKRLQIEQRISKADLVISGEGRVDLTSLSGKVVGGLAAMCKKAKVPLWVIAGSFADTINYQNLGITQQLPLPCCKNFAGAEDITHAVRQALQEFS